MARLIDDIRAQGRVAMPWFVERDKIDAWERHTTRVIELLHNPALPVLLIENVAEYFYTANDQEDWSLETDFPNLAPPFPMFWLEYRMPRLIHSRQGDTDMSRLLPQGGRIGQLIVAVERDQWKGEGIPENVKWILWCEHFADYHRRGACADGTHGPVFMCIDAEGRLVDKPWMQSFAAEKEAENMRRIMACLHPALLAISFLHCKNVKIVENTVPPKWERRYRKRNHGARPTGFKTLVIEPLKQILRTEGRSGEHGLAKAMHICRGHFRDYRQGPGLFGKYHQLVWTPSVVRGTKGKGGAAPREMEIKV